MSTQAISPVVCFETIEETKVVSSHAMFLWKTKIRDQGKGKEPVTEGDTDAPVRTQHTFEEVAPDAPEMSQYAQSLGGGPGRVYLRT